MVGRLGIVRYRSSDRGDRCLFPSSFLYFPSRISNAELIGNFFANRLSASNMSIYLSMCQFYSIGAPKLPAPIVRVGASKVKINPRNM